MMKTKTAWLAFSLLVAVSISAVVAMTAGTWQTVTTTVEAMSTDQTVAPVEPVVDDAPAKLTNWPEASNRETADRDTADAPPSLILRGAELPAEPPPAVPAVPAAMPPSAPGSVMNITNRHWHDANAGIKMAATNAQQMAPPTAQQIRRARDSKAEMRVKRSKSAANTRTCAPPSNAFAGLLRKLNLSPRCPT
jgi:hypothetical protein